MSLIVVARPQYSQDRVCLFNEKIGISPFTITKPATMLIKNRVNDIMKVKPIENINKFVIRQYFIEKIIPAVKEI